MEYEPIEITLTKKSDGSTNVDLTTTPVRPDLIERYDSIVVEDETSAFTYVRVGKYAAGRYWWFREQKNPLAGTLYWSRDPLYLLPGQYLVIRFNGTTTGDILTAYCYGVRRVVK